jgi:hypothetical protein
MMSILSNLRVSRFGNDFIACVSYMRYKIDSEVILWLKL